MPAPMQPTSLWSVSITSDEISLVCESSLAPPESVIESDWVTFRVSGQIPFCLTGVVASFTSLLAEAGIPVFVISTYDTDYVLVPASYQPAAQKALEARYVFVNAV